jgi:hypothetical protein
VPGRDVDVVVVTGPDVVDRADVERGAVVDVVDVDERTVVDVRGALVEGAGGSVVEVRRVEVVRATVSGTVPIGETDSDAGRTSKNTTRVTTKTAPNTAVDLRTRPRISSGPPARCSSRGRAAC